MYLGKYSEDNSIGLYGFETGPEPAFEVASK